MNNTYIDNLKKRYATKIFDPTKKLTSQQSEILEQALVLTPSSFGLQPYKFVKVKNAELKQKLREVSWDQSQVTDCDEYYVLCARTDINQQMIKDYIQLIATTRNIETTNLEGYEQLMLGMEQSLSNDEKIIWAQRQVYIALGFLLDAAAQNNIDACPMEGFDAKAYDEILGLNDLNLIATVACAIGFRSSEDVYANYAKVRLDTNSLVIYRD